MYFRDEEPPPWVDPCYFYGSCENARFHYCMESCSCPDDPEDPEAARCWEECAKRCK